MTAQGLTGRRAGCSWLRAAGALLLCGLLAVRADLPVHCVHEQVVGSWVFLLGPGGNGNDLSCGHKHPDRWDTMDTLGVTWRKPNFDVQHHYKVTLDEPNVATDGLGKSGHWTMVYDEGFELHIGDRVFFAFFRYEPRVEHPSPEDVDDFNSMCDQTFTGWFRSRDDPTQDWGCFIGKQVKPKYLELPPRFQQTRAKLSLRSIASAAFYHASSRYSSGSSARQAAPLKLNALGMFEPDMQFVQLVNSDAASSWRASSYAHWDHERVGHIAKLMRSRHGSGRPMRRFKKTVPTDTSDLPEHFDWRNHNGVNYDTPVTTQGACGSCYAISAVDSINIRQRIASKLGKTQRYSPQDVVSCSDYNQGCDGGYPYLVGKYAREFALLTEECHRYSEDDDSCDNTCPDAQRDMRSSSYYYIGGFYGACNEADMMRDIYDHGPIVVALNAPSSLFYYTDGVYSGHMKEDEVAVDGNSRWEKTNHAVLAMGWGVLDGKKYWLIKNSWGPDWGQDGYFRLLRGEDNIASESMAVGIRI
eukprot:PLAT1687.1.p1 GENE.PLAT1687.1~~PLAT1687.1.p1  ORF type:complete len:548 (-),score=240.10 PLAT1687.1:74-1660(-)